MRARLTMCLILGLVVASGCQSGRDEDESALVDTTGVAAADSEAVRHLVEEMGKRLERVSLFAPRDQLSAALLKEYAGLVTPALLNEWLRDPAKAPGRVTSSPWPDEIEIQNIDRDRVTGHVIERSSADPPGQAGIRIPVKIRVKKLDANLRIASFEQDRSAIPEESTASADEPSAAAAGNVVRDYYRAIGERRYRDAYELWESAGAASGQSLESFQAGFRNTAAVQVDIPSLGRVEGAAGSRFVEIPVRVDARLKDGTTQKFAGVYTLRRSVVDGATPEQRAWRIHSADVREID